MKVKDFLEVFMTDVTSYEVIIDNKVKELSSTYAVCELYGDCIVSSWNVYSNTYPEPYVLVKFENIVLRMKGLINIP